MTFSSLKLGLIAGVVLPLGLAAAAMAEGGPPPTDAASAPAHADRWRDPAAREAAMAQRLRDALQLQPSQDAALAAFIAAMHPPGDHDRMDHDQMGHDDAQLTTPERMDRMLARFDAMRQRMVVRIDATKTFYAQLTPTQQKAFDALPMGRMHGGGHDGGMDGHHGLHHGDGDDHQMGPGGPPHG